MRKWAKAELGLINKLTGEIYDAEIRIAKRQGGRFMKLWQGTEWNSRLVRLQGGSARLLLYLMEIANWKNEVPGPVKVSEAMVSQRSSVSRAYTELIKAEFLYKVGGIYKLSPYYCWKGNDEQYEEACREVADKKASQLPRGELPQVYSGISAILKGD